MKILLATTILPFAKGGATLLTNWLEKALRSHGHEVDVLHLPFSPDPHDLLEQTLALRLLDLGEQADRLITMRPPSYVLRHPQKVVWFIHHHRGLYDWWGTPYQALPDTPEGHGLRNAVIRSDNQSLQEARALFVNSHVMADRLSQFNQLSSEVLYPPVWAPERFHNEAYDDYLLYVSRMVNHKRQHLAVEALAYTKTPVRLVFAGPAEQPEYLAEMQALAERQGTKDRIRFLTRWISEDEKVSLIARCLAVVYIPLDEDSYGFPTLEAHHAEKAIITTTDAGGVRELVFDGQNGDVCEPSPEALAEAMDRLYEDRQRAKQMGQAGRERLSTLQICWDHVVERLLA